MNLTKNVHRHIVDPLNRRPLRAILRQYLSTQGAPAGPLDQFLSKLDHVSESAIPVDMPQPPPATNFIDRLNDQRRLMVSKLSTPNHFAPPPSAHQLRPYQEECINASLDAFLKNNIRRQVVSLPVGSGKTVIFANLLQRVPIPKPGATKVLVLAHRKELLDQAKNQIQRAAPHLKVVVDGAGHLKPKDLSEYHVVVASVAALGNCNYTRLTKYNPNQFKMIIIDEAHHAAAISYIRIMDHFDIWNPHSHLYVWGCSATLRRSDALSLGKVFESVVYESGFLDMIDNGHLCNFRLETLRTPISLKDVPSQSGDYAIGKLCKAINVRSRNDIIVKTWLRVQAERVRMSTLVFAANIEHIQELANEFSKHNVDARMLHSNSNLSIDERKLLIQQFRDFQFPVLINCGILTEGTDIPNIDCIILARPTKSGVLYQQMLGRGLRLHALKTDCLVIDVVDQTGKANLVTTPSLLGLDPTFGVRKNTTFTELAELATSLLKHDLAHEVKSMEDADLSLKEKLDSLSTSIDDVSMFGDVGMNSPLSICIQSLLKDEAIELIHKGTAAEIMEQIKLQEQLDDEYGDERIQFRSLFDWFFLRPNVLAINLPDKSVLTIDATEYPKFKVISYYVILKEHGKRLNLQRNMSKQISGDSVSMLITACDGWIKRNHPTTYFLCLKTAASKSRSISDAQIRYLNKLGYVKIPVWNRTTKSSVVDEKHRTELLNKMTKNQAGKAITRILLRDRTTDRKQVKYMKMTKKEMEKKKLETRMRAEKGGIIKIP